MIVSLRAQKRKCTVCVLSPPLSVSSSLLNEIGSHQPGSKGTLGCIFSADAITAWEQNKMAKPKSDKDYNLSLTCGD